MKFTDPFDEAVAMIGPGSVFVLTYEGELQLEVKKSRDLWRQHLDAAEEERRTIAWQHCLVTDFETKWPYYLLITSAVLCRHYRQASIECFPSFEETLQELKKRRELFYQENS